MWLQLDGEGPLHGQAYRALRGAILAGALRRGARLPATRGLASELGISRNTLLQAYEQLVDEGYAVGRTGSGTFATKRSWAGKGHSNGQTGSWPVRIS